MAKHGMLERTLGRLRRYREETSPAPIAPRAFRAVVDERLRNLERQLDEVKGRVNGLIYLLAGTVLVQAILRLVA